MDQPQPYLFKRPNRLLAFWVLILIIIAGLVVLQVGRSYLSAAILSPLV